MDFDEVFAPVSKYATLRGLLAVPSVKDMKILQPDIKTAFLNGVLEKEVYVEQPAGYEEDGREIGYHLNKVLYGLKQAPRAWIMRLTEELAAMKLKLSKADAGHHIADGKAGKVGHSGVCGRHPDCCADSGGCLASQGGPRVQVRGSRPRGCIFFSLAWPSSGRNRAKRVLKMRQKCLTAQLVGKYTLAESKGRTVPLSAQAPLHS